MDPPKASLFFDPDKVSNDPGLRPDTVQKPASLHPWPRVVLRHKVTIAKVKRIIILVFNLGIFIGKNNAIILIQKLKIYIKFIILNGTW